MSSDPGPPASVAPPVPTPAQPNLPTPQTPAAPARRRRLFRLPYAGRAAAALVLVGLIGFAGWMIGMQVWGYYQLQAARDAVEHYHNRQAKEHLAAYLSVWPHEPNALLLAARTARRVGLFDHAAHLLDNYEKARGKDDDDLILERVLLQAQRGRVEQVADFCEARVRDKHPSAPLVLEAVTAGLIADYRKDEAADRLQEWLTLRPDDCQALLQRGILNDMQGRTDEAIADYKTVLNRDADNEDARMRLAALLLQNNRPTEAFRHLDRLRKALPDNSRIQVQSAQCLVEMGQTDEARRQLDDVLARLKDLAPAEAWEARGKLAKQDGDLEKAETLLREAVAREPGSTDAWFNLYTCLYAEQKDAEAQKAKDAADAVEKDLKEIQEIVGGKMQRSPHDPALHTRAGEIALRTGAYADGRRWLQSALELDPHYAPAHRALARYYEQIGDKARAAQHQAQADGP